MMRRTPAPAGRAICVDPSCPAPPPLPFPFALAGKRAGHSIEYDLDDEDAAFLAQLRARMPSVDEMCRQPDAPSTLESLVELMIDRFEDTTQMDSVRTTLRSHICIPGPSMIWVPRRRHRSYHLSHHFTGSEAASSIPQSLGDLPCTGGLEGSQPQLRAESSNTRGTPA